MYLHQSSNTCVCALPHPALYYALLVPCHSSHTALHTYCPSLSLPPPPLSPLSPNITTPFFSYYRVQIESTQRFPAHEMGEAEAMAGEALGVASVSTHVHTTGMNVIEMPTLSSILGQDLDSSSSSSATVLRTEQDQDSSSSSSGTRLRTEQDQDSSSSSIRAGDYGHTSCICLP